MSHNEFRIVTKEPQWVNPNELDSVNDPYFESDRLEDLRRELTYSKEKVNALNKLSVMMPYAVHIPKEPSLDWACILQEIAVQGKRAAIATAMGFGFMDIWVKANSVSRMFEHADNYGFDLFLFMLYTIVVGYYVVIAGFGCIDKELGNDRSRS